MYQNELDNAYFPHNMAYRAFKDLIRKTVSGNVLRDKAFNIAKIPKCDRYQRHFVSMVYKFLDKKDRRYY